MRLASRTPGLPESISTDSPDGVTMSVAPPPSTSTQYRSNVLSAPGRDGAASSAIATSHRNQSLVFMSALSVGVLWSTDTLIARRGLNSAKLPALGLGCGSLKADEASSWNCVHGFHCTPGSAGAPELPLPVRRKPRRTSGHEGDSCASVWRAGEVGVGGGRHPHRRRSE